MSTESNPDYPATKDDCGQVSDDLICLACGYNLRGLGRTGGCPECGLSIQHTISARQGMTKRELAALVFRILALWYFLDALLDALEMSRYLYGELLYFLWSAAAMILFTGMLVLMWFKADLLAKWFIKTDGPVSLSGRFLASQVMPFAIGLIGVMYLIYGVIGVIWTFARLVLDTNDSFSNAGLVNAVINLVVGWVLVFGAGRIARFVLWMRMAGTRKA